MSTMPEGPDLFFAFKLPPEKAVEYFKSKGMELTWDWFDMWQEAHAKAFTVAKCLKLDVLQDLRGIVDKSISEGMGFSEFQSKARSILATKGWGLAGPDQDIMGIAAPWRVKTIYETNLQTALNVGRYREMMENVDNRPYWQYIAVMDSSTRPAHAALNGKVFRYDDPIWKKFYPPNGFRCRCRVRALTADQVKAMGLTVETSQGKLGTIEKLVSKKTGELVDVTEYTDPFTGLKISPDVGWDYNPGAVAWEPNLTKYDYATASRYVADSLSGPSFARFVEGKQGGRFPVSVLPDKDAAILGSESRTVLLSQETMQKQVKAHPDLTTDDYQKLPKIISEGEVYQQGALKLIYLWEDETLYRAAVKTTSDGQENYLVSLFKTTDKNADRDVRRKYKKIR